jgi:hypothetical protein
MNTKKDIVCFMTNTLFVLGWILLTYISYQEFKIDIYEFESKDMYAELCDSNQMPTIIDSTDSLHNTKPNVSNMTYIGHTDI